MSILSALALSHAPLWHYQSRGPSATPGPQCDTVQSPDFPASLRKEAVTSLSSTSGQDVEDGLWKLSSAVDPLVLMRLQGELKQESMELE